MNNIQETQALQQILIHVCYNIVRDSLLIPYDKTNIALVTITNDTYINYTIPMVFSFLIHNPWFNGDIIYIYDDNLLKLSDENKSKLNKIYSKTIFHLSNKNEYQTSMNNFAPFCMHERFLCCFYKYDIFKFTQYEKILYLDSDMIIKESLLDIFQLNCNLGVVSNGLSYIQDIPPQKYFNAGFMYFGNKTYINKETNIKVKEFSDNIFPSFLAEQDVLNQFFSNNEKTMLVKAYNSPNEINDDDWYDDNAKIIHFWTKPEKSKGKSSFLFQIYSHIAMLIFQHNLNFQSVEDRQKIISECQNIIT